MKYPANNIEDEGETVYNTYYPQLAVDRVYGASVHVKNTDYDAAVRDEIYIIVQFHPA